MKRIAIVASVLLLQTMVVAPSFSGGYVQGAFALQWPTGDVKDAWDNGNVSTNYLGGALAAGFFLTDWLAVQGRLQVIDQRGYPAGGGVPAGTTPLALLYAGEVKLYPFQIFSDGGGLLQPYAIAGIGAQTEVRMDCDACSSSTNFLFELGGGLDIMLGDNFGLFAEFEYQLVTVSEYGFDIENANQLGFLAGITYRF